MQDILLSMRAEDRRLQQSLQDLVQRRPNPPPSQCPDDARQGFTPEPSMQDMMQSVQTEDRRLQQGRQTLRHQVQQFESQVERSRQMSPRLAQEGVTVRGQNTCQLRQATLGRTAHRSSAGNAEPSERLSFRDYILDGSVPGSGAKRCWECGKWRRLLPFSAMCASCAPVSRSWCGSRNPRNEHTETVSEAVGKRWRVLRCDGCGSECMDDSKGLQECGVHVKSFKQLCTACETRQGRLDGRVVNGPTADFCALPARPPIVSKKKKRAVGCCVQ